MVDMRSRPIGTDTDGFEAITEAVKMILNQFPGLNQDDNVKFEELTGDYGIAFSNNSGALVYDEKKDILGMIHQECQYPFFLIYRTRSDRERSKLVAQQFLDVYGKWLCQEPTIYEHSYPPLKYPKLTGSRKITNVSRDNIYSQDPQDNGVQDWVLPVTMEYTSKFRKRR